MIARLSAFAAMAAAVAWTYFPAGSFAFLNWDDQWVILRNPSLGFPGVARWAFTTTYMEHYQPLSWLTWAAIEAGFGPDARAFHVKRRGPLSGPVSRETVVRVHYQVL